MKLFKKVLAGLAAVSTLGLAGPANATLTNWYLDTDGAAGSATAKLVKDYVDLVGQAYVSNSFVTASAFTFNESGIFTTASADGGAALGGNDLSPSLVSSFTGSGQGSVGAPGTLSFLGGTLTIRSGATTVGTFSLVDGSAVLNANSTLPNGTVSLVFKATTLAAGYFFDSSMTDLSTLLSLNDLVFGFATTNVIDLSNRDGDNNPATNPVTVASSLIDLYNVAFNPDKTNPVIANSVTDLYLSNNGQFRLAVPEPGSLALLGIAMLGSIVVRRRRVK